MPPSQHQHERIVAYLDGELSAEESAQVEQQLATDEQFRQQLQGAERAWTALDELPMPAVGEDFSHTTMEMVVNVARQDVEARTIALPVQRRKNRFKTALLAMMAVLLGVLFFRVVWHNRNRRLLADLPVIQNVDIYSQFNSVEFLQQLHNQLGNDARLLPVDEEQLQDQVKDFQRLAALGNRKGWLRQLPEEDKTALWAKYNQFRDLSPTEQAKRRTLHQEIDSANQSEQLLHVMYRYQQWINGLSQSKQYELRKLSDAERVALVAMPMRRDADEQRFELTSQQLSDLKTAVKPYVEKIIKQKLTQMSTRQRRDLLSMSERQRIRELFGALRRSPDLMEKFNKIVVQTLPAEVKKEFEKLLPHEKDPVVVRWLWQARSAQAAKGRRSGSRQRPGEISEQAREDFFVNELDSTEKERLLALPRDKMRRQLEDMMNRGSLPEHEWRFSPDEGRRQPPGLGPPPDHRRHDRRGDFRGDGPPPHGPPRGPRFDNDQRPPRGSDRDRPPRRRRPAEESSLED